MTERQLKAVALYNAELMSEEEERKGKTKSLKMTSTIQKKSRLIGYM